jgi:hypothetical protein
MNADLFNRITSYQPAEFGELTAENVVRIVTLCAIRPSDREAVALGEDVPVVISESATHNHEFHAGRLREHEREIRVMCDRLDPKFKETGGRGAWYGFANCTTYPGTFEEGKTAATWGPSAYAGYLVALGLAVGKIKWLAPRDQWAELPAGLPYFVVLAEPGENVPPPIQLEDPIKTQNPIVPWVFDMGSRIASGAKKLIRPNLRKKG